MKVRYDIPVTRDQGPCTIVGTSSSQETAADNALWQYNSMREHDGQRPLKYLPPGTRMKRLKEEE